MIILRVCYTHPSSWNEAIVPLSLFQNRNKARVDVAKRAWSKIFPSGIHSSVRVKSGCSLAHIGLLGHHACGEKNSKRFTARARSNI